MNSDAGDDDWRSEITTEGRGLIVSKISETLSRHFLAAGFCPEELSLDPESIAVRFEEKVYTEAASRHDYLRTIAIKMLIIGKNDQNLITTANSSPIISAGNVSIPVNPAQADVQPNQQRQERQRHEQQEPPMHKNSCCGNRRWQLQTESRQHIVNKIIKTLRRHIPFSGQEGFLEAKDIAERFETRIYGVATSQPDYLKKLSMEVHTTDAEPHGQNQNQNAYLMSSRNRRMPQDPGTPTTLEEHSSVMATLSQVRASLAYLQQYVEDRCSYIESQVGDLNTRVDALYPRDDGYAATPVHSLVGSPSSHSDEL